MIVYLFFLNLPHPTSVVVRFLFVLHILCGACLILFTSVVHCLILCLSPTRKLFLSTDLGYDPTEDALSMEGQHALYRCGIVTFDDACRHWILSSFIFMSLFRFGFQ